MKQLVILSGKGGTGKTSLAAAFAHLARDGPVSLRAVLADADVDAANLELVLQPHLLEQHEFMGGSKAVIDPAKCEGCGEGRFCSSWGMSNTGKAACRTPHVNAPPRRAAAQPIIVPQRERDGGVAGTCVSGGGVDLASETGSTGLVIGGPPGERLGALARPGQFCGDLSPLFDTARRSPKADAAETNGTKRRQVAALQNTRASHNPRL